MNLIKNLAIFKSIYSKIKSKRFDWCDHYAAVISRIEYFIRKISKTQSNHLIQLDIENGNNINEFSEQELVGVSASFDSRTGNRYTRRSHIKDIYSKFNFSDNNGLGGTTKHRIKTNLVKLEESKERKFILAVDLN